MLVRVHETTHNTNKVINLIHSYCLSFCINRLRTKLIMEKPANARNNTYTNYIAPNIGSRPAKQKVCNNIDIICFKSQNPIYFPP